MFWERVFQTLFVFALAIALVMALHPQPPHIPGNPSDKAQHMAAFAALGVLAAFAYPRLSLIVLFVGLACFGGLIEAVQALPFIGRSPDWLDWFADLAAAFVVLILIGTWRRVSQRGKPRAA